MKGTGTIFKILALVCFLQFGETIKTWDDLRVRYDFLKSRAFHRVPIATTSSLIEEFVKVEPEADFNLPLDFYCYPQDPRACLMFDKKGNVAGIQTSFLKMDVASVSPLHYNYSGNVNYKETNFFNIPAYSFRAYFTNPEKLTVAGRENITETAEGVWVYLEGKLYEIPRHEPTADKFDDFYKQGCLRSMGIHYFYKVDKSLTDCRLSFPLFALYEDKSLVGFGLATAGKGSKGPKREWYEHPPRLALSIIVPHRPQCFDDLAKKYGLTSMHVYLVDKPWDITCSYFGNVLNIVTDWIPL